MTVAVGSIGHFPLNLPFLRRRREARSVVTRPLDLAEQVRDVLDMATRPMTWRDVADQLNVEPRLRQSVKYLYLTAARS